MSRFTIGELKTSYRLTGVRRELGVARDGEWSEGTSHRVQAKVNYDFLPDPRMGWGDLVRHLEIVELDVNPHAILLEPYVKLLANELRRRMDAFESPRTMPSD